MIKDSFDVPCGRSLSQAACPAQWGNTAALANAEGSCTIRDDLDAFAGLDPVQALPVPLEQATECFVSHGLVSIITSEQPVTLGKRFSLTAKGLEKSTSAQMSVGHIAVRNFSGVEQLVDLLKKITTSQALCASVPKAGGREAKIVTKAALSKNPGAITRSKDCLDFAAGQAGLMILDYDPCAEGATLSQDELVAALLAACPEVAQAGVVWWCSGSSLLFSGEQEIQGLRGQRLYVLVQDAGDMKRAGEVLSARFWLSAHGRVQVSASGQLLVRSLFDQAMFQPARLDFIGGAVCEAPLEQRRGSPVSVCGQGWLDTASALRDLNADEQQRYNMLVAQAKADKLPDADKAKGVWMSSRLGTATATLIQNGVQPQEARRSAEKTLHKALKGELSGDFLIQLADGTTLSVAAALKEPERWNEALTLDPLEPDYDGGRIVGKLYLRGATPCLYSYAHGGSRYVLHRQPVSMLCQPGEHAPLVQQLTDFLIDETDIFVHGKDLVQLVDDKLMLLDEFSICLLAGNRVTLFKLDKKGIEIPADLPVAVAKMILSALPTFKFRQLQALITLPCTTSEGRVLDRTGYDAETGLYLKLPSTWVACSNAPITQEALIDAVKKLWAPWSQYRFATECDRGAMLAAVLTAVNRPVLDRSPGFAIDAPVPACGKTLLAEALNCLICGRHGAGMVAHKKDQQADVELQKQLMTLTRHGISVLLLDNVDAYLDSATLASLLTSGSISGRLLNTNDWYAADHRLFFTMTSNNASLSRDLSQRMVRVRIDPQTENPQARRFAFSPSDLALSMRADIAAAVLFLMRAYTEAGMPQLSSDDARFPQWSKLIRNAVLWLQQEGLGVAAGIGELGDPADSIVHQKTQNDPKTMVLAELLNALHERFGVHPFLARTIVTICNGPPEKMDQTQQVIYESMLELCPPKYPFTAFTISTGLRNMRDKISNARKLMATKNRTGTMDFRIALCP